MDTPSAKVQMALHRGNRVAPNGGNRLALHQEIRWLSMVEIRQQLKENYFFILETLEDDFSAKNVSYMDQILKNFLFQENLIKNATSLIDTNFIRARLIRARNVRLLQAWIHELNGTSPTRVPCRSLFQHKLDSVRVTKVPTHSKHISFELRAILSQHFQDFLSLSDGQNQEVNFTLNAFLRSFQVQRSLRLLIEKMLRFTEDWASDQHEYEIAEMLARMFASASPPHPQENLAIIWFEMLSKMEESIDILWSLGPRRRNYMNFYNKVYDDRKGVEVVNFTIKVLDTIHFQRNSAHDGKHSLGAESGSRFKSYVESSLAYINRQHRAPYRVKAICKESILKSWASMAFTEGKSLAEDLYDFELRQQKKVFRRLLGLDSYLNLDSSIFD